MLLVWEWNDSNIDGERERSNERDNEKETGRDIAIYSER